MARLLRGEGARRLRELGCGTGRHALELARAGFRVQGLERSPGMLAAARARRAGAAPASRRRLSLVRGDLRRPPPGRFDAVLALFHVFGYLRGPADLAAAFAAAAKSLRPGGLLILDAWTRAPRPGEGRPRRAALPEGGRLARRSRARPLGGGLIEVLQSFEAARPGRGPRHWVERHLLRVRARAALREAASRAGLSLERVLPGLPALAGGRGGAEALYLFRRAAAAAPGAASVLKTR